MACVQSKVARCRQKHRGERKCWWAQALACKSINIIIWRIMMATLKPHIFPSDLAWIKLADEEVQVKGGLRGQWHLNECHHWPWHGPVPCFFWPLGGHKLCLASQIKSTLSHDMVFHDHESWGLTLLMHWRTWRHPVHLMLHAPVPQKQSSKNTGANFLYIHVAWAN